MIKKTIKTVVTFLLCFSIIFSLFGCYGCNSTNIRALWITFYSSEQHLQRLNNILPEKIDNKYAEKAIEEKLDPDDKISYKVLDLEIMIIKAFDERPEFFLVELLVELTEEEKTYIYNCHIMGVIKYDKYYFFKPNERSIFNGGKSKWEVEGIPKDNRYFACGNTYGYKDEDGNIYAWQYWQKKWSGRIYKPEEFNKMSNSVYNINRTIESIN